MNCTSSRLMPQWRNSPVQKMLPWAPPMPASCIAAQAGFMNPKWLMFTPKLCGQDRAIIRSLG